MRNTERLTAPCTLNLEERAEAALNALIGVADTDYNYVPFFSGFLTSKPAWMSHGNWDYGSSHGRLVDAIVCARAMTGSDFGKETEEHYRKNLLTYFHSDGLSYRKNTFTKEELASHDSRFEESAEMIDQRAVLVALTSWFLETGDEAPRAAADKLVAGLHRIAVKERESWYYPGSEYTSHGWPSFDAVHTRLTPDPAAMWGRQSGPLLKYYEATGNRQALELAENFIYNIIHRSGVFNPDGSFNGGIEHRNGHFHTRMGTLSSIAKLASITGDASMMGFVKRSFDWARTKCTSFGWTPGDLHDQCYEHETCTLVDAIATAFTLAKAGFVEYWGIAERFVRNQLAASQLLDISWIDECDDKSNDIPGVKTYYKVAQRLRGGFAGYAAPNDFVNDGFFGRGHIMDMQTCCLGSGTRALYTVWSNAITEKNGRVFINLLLNKGTEKLDVLSYLPYEGRVELKIKEDIDELYIRIPEWTPYGRVEVRFGENTPVNGGKLPWINTYFLKLGHARRGESITVLFPLVERKTVEQPFNVGYDVKWIGDDAVNIEPEGKIHPFYHHLDFSGKPELKPAVFHTGKENIYE